jgi:hypothetical protein
MNADQNKPEDLNISLIIPMRYGQFLVDQAELANTTVDDFLSQLVIKWLKEQRTVNSPEDLESDPDEDLRPRSVI